MKFKTLFAGLMMFFSATAFSQVLVEAEQFEDYGGWKLDQQFMDQMGSPYIMAHGMGVPVKNACTQVELPAAGKWKVLVRTFNWTSPWYQGEDKPGFKLKAGGKEFSQVLGQTGTEWMWQEAGIVNVSKKNAKHSGDKWSLALELVDLDGFNSRVDAILLTQDMDYVPPTGSDELRLLRKQLLGLPLEPEPAGHFDLVVTGGGVAGCAAALTAARLGLKVALIDDRPVLGGANTAGIKVGLGGGMSHNLYPHLSDIVREISNVPAYVPEEAKKAVNDNHPPKSNRDFHYLEKLRTQIFTNEPNITLFLSTRVYDVVMKNASEKGHWIDGTQFIYDTKVDNNEIQAVLARNVVTGREYILASDLFVDTTGDGCVGFLAGADYRIGRESFYETFEPSAPYISDNLKMGLTIQWNSKQVDSVSTFPVLPWAVQCDDNYHIDARGSSWNWETGFDKDPFQEAERCRDNALRSIYGNWSYLKNHRADKYGNRNIAAVGYLSGKRESRRLLGDVILKENDIFDQVDFPDKSFTATWSMDLHYADEENSKFFPGNEWMSWCAQPKIKPYHVPYRILYSRNIKNLFMAGRCCSVTHVALGTVRVQVTCGMMGVVVGMAAKVCRDHDALPRDVYSKYLSELQHLMETGVPSIKNNY